MQTLYWHDYETWGTDPGIDRPAQFAGLRTDADLNIVGEPLVIYCQPPEDVLPHPEACLITGIAPQKALHEGLVEAEFIAQIHAQLAQPGTCGLGYNSIRFDDELTRYTLYRNFYDPYEREWNHGNSRWDLIDTVRLCYALRPEGLNWPVDEAGKPSFRLERLTQANGLIHSAAHDALSDVEATIALARLIRSAQPALYNYAFEHRQKSVLAGQIDVQAGKPLLHISAKFPAENGCAGLVLPLAWHPTNKNALIVVNLSADPADLIGLDADSIAERVFCRADDLPEGASRIALKLIHLNKCPILLTPKLLTDAAAHRLGIDKTQCERHWQRLLQHDLQAKVQQVFALNEFTARKDVECRLYDGFIGRADKSQMARVRNANAEALAREQYVFEDERLGELLWRYKARNFPQALSPEEQQRWQQFCYNRLSNGDEGVLSVAALQERIRQIDAEQDLNKDQKIVLRQLYRYSLDLAQKYQLGRKCSW